MEYSYHMFLWRNIENYELLFYQLPLTDATVISKEKWKLFLDVSVNHHYLELFMRHVIRKTCLRVCVTSSSSPAQLHKLAGVRILDTGTIVVILAGSFYLWFCISLVSVMTV